VGLEPHMRRAVAAACLLLLVAGDASAQSIPEPGKPYRSLSADKQKAYLLENLTPYLPVPGQRFPVYRERRRVFRISNIQTTYGRDLYDDLYVLHFQFPTSEAARLACSWFAWDRATNGYRHLSRPLDPALHPPWYLEALEVGGKSIWYQGRSRTYPAYSGRYLRPNQIYFWPTIRNGLVFVYHTRLSPQPRKYLAKLVATFPPASKKALILDPATWVRRAGPALIDALAAAKKPAVREVLDRQLRWLVLTAREVPESQPATDVPAPSLARKAPKALVRGWRAWWSKHGGLSRIDWCRMELDALVRRGRKLKTPLRERAWATIEAIRLLSEVFGFELHPPAGVTREQLWALLRRRPRDASVAKQWTTSLDRVTSLIASWWAGCRGGRPIDWYRAYLRLFLLERDGQLWVKLNNGLLRLEGATLGQAPQALRLTSLLKKEAALARYSAWRKWLDGSGARFRPSPHLHDKVDVRVWSIAPDWLQSLLPVPSWVKGMTGVPSFVDRNGDLLANWLTPLRSALLPGILVESRKPPKHPKDLPSAVSVKLSEHRTEVPLDWWLEDFWRMVRDHSRSGEFQLPKYVQWGKGGPTVLLCYPKMGAGAKDVEYARAFWLAPAGPKRRWAITLEGPVAECKRVGQWVQRSFPSLLDPSLVDLSDWGGHVRRLVDWRFQVLKNPRWGVDSGRSVSWLVSHIKPGFEVIENLPRDIGQYFLLRERLSTIWRANRAETPAARFRRFVDSTFSALRDPKRSPRWRLETIRALTITLQSIGQIPRSNFGRFPFVGRQKDDDAIVKRVIADWHTWWRKNRLLPRTELARKLLDQHIRCLPDRQDSTYRVRDVVSRATLLQKWLRPYLPQRLAALKPGDSKVPEKIERQLRQWWKDNRKRCFLRLPPWYI